MRFDDGRLQHHETEIFVDADLQIGEPLRDRLILADIGCNELQEIVIAAGDEMALNDLVNLFDRRQETGEVDLPVVLQGNLGENR
ncbi:hypothetical protein GGI59_006307 [Rhizobium lentis]|uniref:Uncharacterized protein n=1 Tax=Rhizobium lentis TaxID=1138194 RepID=A0A7W9CYJ4_9HYPH|nr:hypothetical protein [Rhizobium lentis]MBB5554042.1 hypothetical protein [Rhizobium lentis]MBB5564598.1 hypothetical protein [Rhizobium lentis]MBB5571154.1 hypothetical protein [Rhizobium lentis]